TLSEFRKKIGIPLFLIKKLINLGIIEGERALDGTMRIASSEVVKAKEFLKSPRRKIILFIKTLGPGLITGAADDDPGGIGTYSSVGARFGFTILWMAPWLLPLTIAVQEVCARIGIVTNRGLTRVLETYYHRKLVAILVVGLLVANIVNIGADIKAMTDSLRLLIDMNFVVLVLFLTLVIILTEIFIPYKAYVKILKWLTLFLFAYVICGFIIHPSWFLVIRKAVIPNIVFSKDYLVAVIAVFGTTISPYLFFWLTSEEVEEKKIQNQKKSMRATIGQMRTDVNTGMILAHLIFFFIILTCAQVLFKNGITNIETAEEAALALKPLAGEKAFLLFALGIIGTGFLAIPVLAGSGAYALSELIRWHEGLSKKFSQAKGFYSIIIISILLGLLINFVGISPIKALYYSAFLNGIIAIPILVVVMIVGNNKKIMGEETHPGWVKFFGWGATIFASLSLLVLLIMHFIK
ncbi:MAG: NRAMP family divalent metal transporter, partial [Minisyncoccia bacterium]